MRILNNIKSFVLEFIKRFKSETPIFFKKIQRFAIWIVTVSTTILLVSVSVKGIKVPNDIISICSYIVVGGTVLGLSAQLPNKDNTQK